MVAEHAAKAIHVLQLWVHAAQVKPLHPKFVFGDCKAAVQMLNTGFRCKTEDLD